MGGIASGSGKTITNKTGCNAVIGGVITLWDVNTGKCLKTLEAPYYSEREERLAEKETFSQVISLVALSDELLASGHASFSVKVWNLKTGKCCIDSYCNSDYHSYPKPVLAILSNEQLALGTIDFVMSGTSRYTRVIIRIINVATGEVLQNLAGHTGSVTSLALLPNGQLASGSADGTVRIWDIATGQCLQILTGHKRGVIFLAALPDGRLASSSSLSLSVNYTDDNGRTIFLNDRSDITADNKGFSYDRSAMGDKTIKVWDVKTGKCQTLAGHTDTVSQLAVLPDGQFASGSRDGTVRIWLSTDCSLFSALMNALRFNSSCVEIKNAMSIIQDNAATISQLIERNQRLQILQKTNPNMTLLHLAAKEGDMESLNLLCSKFNSDTRCSQGKSALTYAIEAQQGAAITFLRHEQQLASQMTLMQEPRIAPETAFQQQLMHQLINTTPPEKQASLFPAKEISREIIVSDLYRCPISKLIMCDPVTTSAHQTYEREAIQTWLLSKKTDPMTNAALTDETLLPNVFAKQTIDEFLTKNPELKHTDEIYLPNQLLNVLKKAIIEKNLSDVRRFIQEDNRVLSRMLVDGRTAFHTACELGTFEILSCILNVLKEEQLKILLALPKPPHFQPAVLNQALFDCMAQNNLSEISRLLYLGANSEARNATDQTPLCKAVELGHVHIVDLLLKAGANISARDANNNAPLDLAVLNHHYNIVHQLLDFGIPTYAPTSPLDQRHFSYAILQFMHEKRSQEKPVADVALPLSANAQILFAQPAAALPAVNDHDSDDNDDLKKSS